MKDREDGEEVEEWGLLVGGEGNLVNVKSQYEDLDDHLVDPCLDVISRLSVVKEAGSTGGPPGETWKASVSIWCPQKHNCHDWLKCT